MTALGHTPLADTLPGLEACVHCGFCLPSCPTYIATGDENDSPRGRIVLMRAVISGALPLSDETVTTHLDRCLDCRACETACPSGVPYGASLEAARESQFAVAERRAPSAETALLWLLAHPTLFRAAMTVARALRASRITELAAGFSLPAAMLAASGPALPAGSYEAKGTGARGRVAILRGCVMDGLFSHVHAATERTLTMNDYAIVPAPGAGCCGALHAHAGDAERARAMARVTIEAFDYSGVEYVAVNAAGCGAMMKEYGRLLENDPTWAPRARAFAAKVRDVSELLAAAGPARGGEFRATVTYDAPCHLRHAQRVVAPPLAMLAAIPELRLIELDGSDVCCGSAGIYNLTQPELSKAILAEKLASITIAGAGLVATGNPGCQMQIGAGLMRVGSKTRVVHPVELLDASYAARTAPKPGSASRTPAITLPA